MTVVAIILAAGKSARFGDGNKLAADFEGTPVIARVIEAAETSKCAGTILVVPPDNAHLLKAAGAGSWLTVVNKEAPTGIASSIRAGIASLPPSVTGVLIMLGDMPWIDSTLIDRLIIAFEESNATAIVFPEAPDGRRGHPVVFPASLFPDLLALQGDSGARSVIDAHPDLHHPLTAATDAIFKDIDTPDDLPVL